MIGLALRSSFLPAIAAAVLLVAEPPAAYAKARMLLCADAGGALSVRKKRCAAGEREMTLGALVAAGPPGEPGAPGAPGGGGPQGPQGPAGQAGQGFTLVVDASVGIAPRTSTPPTIVTARKENFQAGALQATGLTIVNHPTGSVSARLPCAQGQEPAPSSCFNVPGSLGIAFAPPRPGRYLACVTFTHYIDLAQSGTTAVVTGGRTQFGIVETAPTTEAELQGGKSVVSSGFYTRDSEGERVASPHRLCETFAFPDASERVLRLRYRQQQYEGGIDANHIRFEEPDAGPSWPHWEVYFAGE